MGTELNRKFSRKESQMAEKNLKISSRTLVISEMQIKTTLRFHLTPIRMAKQNKTKQKQKQKNKNKKKSCWGRL
jgi:ribosomal protein L6P/L9E